MDGDAVISDWTKLGGLVRDARRDLQLTQVQAAQRAGVSRSWLARVEAGHRGAELAELIRLFDALGLTLRLGASRPTSPGPVDGGASAPSSTTPSGSTVNERARARRLAWSLPPGRELPGDA